MTVHKHIHSHAQSLTQKLALLKPKKTHGAAVQMTTLQTLSLLRNVKCTMPGNPVYTANVRTSQFQNYGEDGGRV